MPWIHRSLRFATGRKSDALAAACLLALWSFAATADEASLIERRDQIRAFNTRLEEQLKNGTYRSKDGFQASRWAMPPAEVQALFAQAIPLGDGSLSWTGTIGGRNAVVHFIFFKNQLAVVVVDFPAPTDVRPDFNDVRDLLKRKWGESKNEQDQAADTAQQVFWSQLLFGVTRALADMGPVQRNTPATLLYLQGRQERNATAEKLGANAQQALDTAAKNYSLRSEWSTPETTITLYGRQRLDSGEFRLVYDWRVMADQVNREFARQKEEKRNELSKEF